MSKVFVSYRREDSADICGRLDDKLADRFGRDNVFKDVDSIPLGSDFRQILHGAVGQCAAMLVVIGKHWLTMADAQGRRRLDNHSDFVRIEIELALARGIPVIPVLVQGAMMPHEDDLSPSISPLAYRQGLDIRSDSHFHRDAEQLLDRLADLLSFPSASSVQKPIQMTPSVPATHVSPLSLASVTEFKPPIFELANRRLGIRATGKQDEPGFWVLRGSQVLADSDIFARENPSKHRKKEDYIQRGVLRRVSRTIFTLQEDVQFTSPSGAAVFVCGTSRNGRKEWTVKGTETSYADWQAAAGRTSASRVRARGRASTQRGSNHNNRLPPGHRTPEDAYVKPILRALMGMGGRAEVNDVYVRVEQLMKGTLREVDYQRVSLDRNSELRWRNVTRLARISMIKQGLLKDDSPRGIWEIADTGRRSLEAM